MDVAERFGLNLARLRQASGLTQADLAARTSMHRTEISLLERGRRVPRIGTLVKLAAALKVETGALLEGIVWLPPASDAGQFEYPKPG